MAEEVTVQTDRERAARRPNSPVERISPLATGLLYGGAASAIAGPFGLLAGLAAGILHKRAKESYLDQVAADAQNTRGEYTGLQDEIKSELEIADPDEKRLLESAQRVAADGWYRLQSGDERGRAMLEQANATIQGIMQGDIQARKAEQAAQFNTQRGLITTAAGAFRDQYSTTVNQARQIDSQAQRILKLVSDPTFDPDKPFSKSVLTELVSGSLGGMFREDPNGLLNGLADLSSSGSEIGSIVGTIARLGKSVADTDEFKISREEYNRIALNIRQVTQQYASKRLEELRQQSEGLNAFAQKVGAIPADYNLADYVSGGVSELNISPELKIPTVQTSNGQPQRFTSPWQMKAQQSQQPNGPPRRVRPQIQAPALSDDWFREQVGIPTQRQRRPTN